MANDQKKNGQAGAAMRGSSSLSQVREILVGPRFREYERRIAKLTTRISKEIESLRTEMMQQGEELEEYVRTEVAALQDQIKKVGAGHGSLIKELQRDARSLTASTDKSVTRLEDKLSRATESLKSHATQQSDKVRQMLEKRCDGLQETVEALEEFVEGAETERESLGKTFQQLVQTLTSDQKSRRK